MQSAILGMRIAALPRRKVPHPKAVLPTSSTTTTCGTFAPQAAGPYCICDTGRMFRRVPVGTLCIAFRIREDATIRTVLRGGGSIRAMSPKGGNEFVILAQCDAIDDARRVLDRGPSAAAATRAGSLILVGI
jgi:hypothetical protein